MKSRLLVSALLALLAMALAACAPKSAPAPAPAPAPAAAPAKAEAPKAQAPKTEVPKPQAAPPAAKDDWPKEKITILVPFNAGGSADRSARGVASFMYEELGVPLVVKNQEGSGALLGHTSFINDKAADEGYTLLMTTQPYISNNILVANAKFKLDDFAVINSHWQDWLFVAAPKNSPYNSLSDLIEDVKKRPGKVVFGVAKGSAGHLMGAATLDALGILKDVNVVTYDGGNPLRTALLGAQLDFTFSTAEGSESILDRLKALAVVLEKPAKEFPNTPIINDALKKYNVTVPLVRGSVRILAAKATFKQKYPERWNKLVAAYKKTLERNDTKRWLKENLIPGDWPGPEASTQMVKTFHDVTAKYGHLTK